MPTTVKLRLKGFVELRNAPGVVDLIGKTAGRIAASAGEGFEVDGPITSMKYPKGRARAAVIAATREAREAEATRRALTRAVASTR